MRVRFADFVLDLPTRELLRGGRRIHLSPKAFQLLAELVENRPRALSKVDLQRRLWPDTFVAEVNVANLVAEVRKALGDGARTPRFVRTVHRFGYAFCADATEVDEPRAGGATDAERPRYRLIWTGGRTTLGEGEYILGRSREQDVWLDSTSVSRRHARLVVSAEGVTLEDLGSKNGTYVRGERLAAPARVAEGDEVRLGSVRIKLRRLGSEGSTDTGSRSRE
jgi:DNA-binding winged helix-turn-helix (wHTH) protein